MAVQLAVTFAALLVEHEHLFALHERRDNLANHLGPFYRGGAYLDVAVVVDEQHFVKLYRLTVGSFVMISSNVEDPDNAKLYVKGESAYTFVTDFSGAQGIKGETGDKGDKGDAGAAATVSIGTVTTGAAGSQAAVTNGGNANAAVLNFSIPKGDKGDKGDDGKTPTFTVNANGELIATFE